MLFQLNPRTVVALILRNPLLQQIHMYFIQIQVILLGNGDGKMPVHPQVMEVGWHLGCQVTCIIREKLTVDHSGQQSRFNR